MRKQSMAGWMVLVAIAVGGCGAQPGTALLTYPRGKTPPPLSKVDESGTYVLYASNSPTPLYTVKMDKGDEFGFRQRPDGAVVAVARPKDGEKEIPLENKLATSYYWKIKD